MKTITLKIECDTYNQEVMVKQTFDSDSSCTEILQALDIEQALVACLIGLGYNIDLSKMKNASSKD